VALEAKIGVAGDQHLVVDRAVRVMTSGASFPHRFMLEDKRSALSGMALAASIVLSQQRCSSAANSRTLVRIVAVGAAHPPIKNRVAVRQLKLPFLVEMTLKTHLR